MRLIVLIAR